jgi:hypothetical protein
MLTAPRSGATVRAASGIFARASKSPFAAQVSAPALCSNKRRSQVQFKYGHPRVEETAKSPDDKT